MDNCIEALHERVCMGRVPLHGKGVCWCKAGPAGLRALGSTRSRLHLPEVLLHQIALFLIEPSYRLCDWMKEHIVWSSLSGNPRAMDMLYADMRDTDPIQKGQKKVSWMALSENPSAIPLLEKNQEKIHWTWLSSNPNAIHLLEKNMDKVDWQSLCLNPNAIPLLEKNMETNRYVMNWGMLSQNPNAIPLLQKNMDNIYWFYLSANPSALSLLEANMEKVDWDMLSQNPSAIHLLEKNLDKVHWTRMCKNLAGIPLLERNMDKVDWDILSLNPAAIPLLEKNLDKVNWATLSMNPCAGPLFQHYPEKAHLYRAYLSFNPSVFEVDLVETERKAVLFVETLRVCSPRLADPTRPAVPSGLLCAGLLCTNTPLSRGDVLNPLNIPP